MFNPRSREHAYRVVSVVILGDRDETAVLALAAGLARTVDEPLSTAIAETASECSKTLGYGEVQLITNKGVAGSVNGQAVVLGNSAFLGDMGLSVGDFGEWVERATPEGEAVIFVAVDRRLAGFLRLSTTALHKK